jgi:hypothetical protein
MNKSARQYRQQGFNPQVGPTCPYCLQPSILRPANYIYKDPQRSGSLWVCSDYPDCNAYVATHKHGPLKDYPLGTLANEELRTARRVVHKVFDVLFKRNQMTREEAYKWLQEELCIPHEEAHIGEMDILKCNLAYTRVLKFLSGEYTKMQESKTPHDFKWL